MLEIVENHDMLSSVKSECVCVIRVNNLSGVVTRITRIMCSPIYR